MRIARYDNPYKCVSYASIDNTVRQQPVALEAADGGLSHGILYTTKAQHSTVLCFMHPRADMSRHYAIPGLLRAGYAVFGQNSRYLNNDATCIHELLVLDVAAATRFLRARGFSYIVLIGNSGGGSLYGLYQVQATTSPPGRIRETPAGDPVNLNEHTLPPADGLVFLAAHQGEGRVLMNMIDPSVTDENDPLSCDPELDPYNPDNGFRHPPEPSKYAPEFFKRYREAQRARVQRLDRIARELLENRRAAREKIRNTSDYTQLPWRDRSRLIRQSVLGRYMVIYRTEADLRALDLSLDPSDRDVGTLFSYRPDLTNYMEFGFARVCTPKAWLSTWSGISSHADLLACAQKISVPVLVVYYTGDNAIFPSDSQAIFEALGSTDKQITSAPGDHYGFGVGSQHRTGAPQAIAQIASWLRDRFPA